MGSTGKELRALFLVRGGGFPKVGATENFRGRKLFGAEFYEEVILWVRAIGGSLAHVLAGFLNPLFWGGVSIFSVTVRDTEILQKSKIVEREKFSEKASIGFRLGAAVYRPGGVFLFLPPIFWGFCLNSSVTVGDTEILQESKIVGRRKS